MRKIIFGLMLLSGAARAWALTPGDFVWRVSTSTPVVALTFDDGPGPDTPKFLALLKEHGAKGTFFMLGEMAKARPTLVKQVVADGHEVASHLYTHVSFAKVPPEEGRASLGESMKKSRAAIETAGGQKLLYCRMPHGVDRPWIREVAKAEGFVLVNWTFGYDWLSLSTEEMAKTYIDKIRPGAIILMHDGGKRQKSADVLAQLLQALDEKGYKAVTVGELLAAYPPMPAQVKKP